MKALVCLVLASFFISSCLAGCLNNTKCGDCIGKVDDDNKTPCGWCAATQMCQAGTQSGPNANPQCRGAAWEWGNCTTCSSFSECRTCLDYNSDCFWCASDNTCKDLSVGTGTCAQPSTTSCPCNTTYSSCQDCNFESRGNCIWCEQDNSCRPTSDPGNCLLTHGRTCPCNENSDCFSCQQQAGCGWCSGANSSCVDSRNNTCSSLIAINGCNRYCQDAGTDCTSCNNVNGCAWCTKLAQCVDVERAPGNCTLLAHTCAVCSDNPTCGTCSMNPQCSWCAGEQMCRPKGSTGCLAALNCDLYCDRFANCDKCSVTKGCTWCTQSQSCVSGENNPLSCSGLIAHSCPVPEEGGKKAGFDAGSFVGGMFLVIGVIGLGAVGFVFYRWKTGQRIDYRELK